MNPVNPLFKVEYDQVGTEINVKRASRLNIMSLSVMLVFVSSYISFLFVYDFGFERIISLTFLISSLILSIMSYLMITLGHNRSFSLVILYSLSFSLFLAFSGKLLNETLLYIWSKDNLIENRYSYIFITFITGMVFSLFVTEIFYFFKVFALKNFYFKYLLIVLTLLIIGFAYMITILKYETGFYLKENLIPYIMSVLYFSFFSVYYKESIRRKLELNVKEKFIVNLSLVMVSLPIFIIPECVNMLIKHKKSQ